MASHLAAFIKNVALYPIGPEVPSLLSPIAWFFRAIKQIIMYVAYVIGWREANTTSISPFHPFHPSSVDVSGNPSAQEIANPSQEFDFNLNYGQHMAGRLKTLLMMIFLWAVKLFSVLAQPRSSLGSRSKVCCAGISFDPCRAEEFDCDIKLPF